MIFLSKSIENIGEAKHRQQPIFRQVIKKLTNRSVRRDSRRLIEEQLVDTSREDEAHAFDKRFQKWEEELRQEAYREMALAEERHNIKFESLSHFHQWEAYQAWLEEWDF